MSQVNHFPVVWSCQTVHYKEHQHSPQQFDWQVWSKWLLLVIGFSQHTHSCWPSPDTHKTQYHHNAFCSNCRVTKRKQEYYYNNLMFINCHLMLGNKYRKSSHTNTHTSTEHYHNTFIDYHLKQRKHKQGIITMTSCLLIVTWQTENKYRNSSQHTHNCWLSPVTHEK